jgi:hypothetical protein
MVRSAHRRVTALASVAMVLLTLPLAAQQADSARRTLTADDYARAERFMGYNTNPLVFRMTVRPNWLPDDRFWYRVTVPGGSEFVLVDPARATKEPAFDHTKLAASLSTAAGESYTALTLPFNEFALTADGRSIEFKAAKRRWRCDRQGKCVQPTGDGTGNAAERRTRTAWPRTH